MRRSFLEDSINAMYVFEKALNGVAINAIKKNNTVPKIFSLDNPGNGLNPTNSPVLDKLVILPTPTAIK